MNDTEKFLFDLQGFLKVPDFLAPAEIDALNAAFDANEDKRGEDGNHNTGGSDALDGRRRGMFAGMLEWEKPHCLPFRALLAHKKLIPYLDALFGRGWKMDHSPFMLCGGKGAEGLILHGSTSRHFNGSQYYAYANDQMRCGMIVCQFQLADVNEGNGGLCVIPGSHKANFPLPQKNLPLAGAPRGRVQRPLQDRRHGHLQRGDPARHAPVDGRARAAVPTLPLLAQVPALCRRYLPNQPAGMGRRAD